MGTPEKENNDNFNLYLKEISRFRPLKRHQEHDLIIRIKKGDKEAMKRLIEANLRFVVSVAINYKNQGMPLSDLVNEGNIGLIKAAQRFNETKGTKFISYAVWWVRQAILQSMAENSRIIKMPLNRVGTIYNVGKVSDKLEQKLKRCPSYKEIARQLKIEENEVQEVFTIGNKHISMDAPVDDFESNLLDLIPGSRHTAPDAKLDEHFIKKGIEKVLNTLKKNEAEIVRLYYGVNCERNYTLEEIANKFGLTRERIRQIKERALIRLKHPSRNLKLKQFYKTF